MKTHSIQSILYPSLNSNLDGISADIFFRGCRPPYCEGCHNLELQRFEKPNKSTEDIINSLKPYVDSLYVVTLMGGEPLDRSHKLLLELIVELKQQFSDIKVAVYTGYNLSQVPLEILEHIDYVKCGQYQGQNKTPFGSFLASKNQIMYQKSKDTWYIQWECQD